MNHLVHTNSHHAPIADAHAQRVPFVSQIGDDIDACHNAAAELERILDDLVGAPAPMAGTALKEAPSGIMGSLAGTARQLRSRLTELTHRIREIHATG